MHLCDNYFNLPIYKENEDPDVLLQLFENNVYRLSLAGIKMPTDLHWVLWLKVIPPTMKSLQDQLGMDPKGTYLTVYQALKGHYNRVAPNESSKTSKNKIKKKNNDESREQLNTGVEKQDKPHKRFNKRQKRKRDDSDQKPNPHCDYCGMNNHVTAKCFQLKRDKEVGTKLAGSDLSGLQGLCFVERTNNGEDGVSLELASNVSQECANTIFLFDSGATTHLTGNRQLLTDVVDVPEVSVGTALKGATAVIRQRGKVILNSQKYLRDVAYVSNATNNLISEGRLCDADCSIYKTKECLVVRDAGGSVILKGPRINRLWIYVTDDKMIRKTPYTTIVTDKKNNRRPPGGSEVDGNEDEQINDDENNSSSSSGTLGSPTSSSSISSTSPADAARSRHKKPRS
jgi:hypothetical protein